MTATDPDALLPDLGGLRILLAEDNEANQIVASEMLRAMGASVDLADDGAAAVMLLADHVYDALVVDIEMPRVSGIDLIRAVRGGAEPLASRPILALTAYPPEDHGACILDAGADAIMTKPIGSIAALGEAVLAPLAERRGGGAATAAKPRAEAAATDAALRKENVLAALERSVGPELMAELLAKFIADIAEARDRMARAAAAGDLRGLRAATHVMISVAGAAGASALSAGAARLNRCAGDGDAPCCAILTPELVAEADAALDRLRDALGALDR